jgi:hypothetical protein
MITLEQFKKANGLGEIDFLKSPTTGREVADLQGISLIISLKCDVKKPLYVTDAINKNGEPILVICNSGWLKGVTL